MKKILFASLCVASALTFTGCVSEEDDIFGSSAPVRLDEAAKTYTERLSSATAGWAMEYYPTSQTAAPKGLGYLLLAKFEPNLSVTVGMKNQFCTPADQYMEDTSSWEIITDNGPVLTFDTYNECIHVFSSPEDVPSTSTDETGVGLEGDYEFVMIDVPENGEFVMLKGKKRGTYTRLTRLDEGTDFETYINDIEDFRNRVFSSKAPNVCMLTLGDSVMKVANASTGICNIYPYDGNAISNESYHTFLVTKRGGKYYLRFRDALNAPDGKEAQEFVYDEERDLFTGVENPEYILEGDQPKEFFTWVMEESGREWVLTRTSEMSDNVKEKYEALRTALSAARGTFNDLALKYENNGYICAINITANRQTKDYKYNINITPSETGYTFTIADPVNEESQRMLTTFPAIQDLLNVFATDFAVSATSSRFNMSTIKLKDANGTEVNLTIN